MMVQCSHPTCTKLLTNRILFSFPRSTSYVCSCVLLPFTPWHSPARNTAVFYLKRQKLPTSILRTSSAARLLTRDEARRIAANIAKLPAKLPAAESGPGAGSPNVRFGSLADIEACPIDVRFTPKSGHGSAQL